MIPNQFHFIYFLVPGTGGKQFSMVHYLAMKSAIEVNNPDRVFFYYNNEPDTEWFKKIRPCLTMVKIDPPSSIYGNPLCHVAHCADIVRLVVLKLYGGIYLDIDTICNRPFKDLLETSSMVMGLQKFSENEFGLCNAVMMAEKNAEFINRWLETYQLFRSPGNSGFWDEHSVRIPRHLAEYLPSLITVAPYDAFHYPTFVEAGIREMFVENHQFNRAYCHHLWENASWSYLKDLSPEIIKSKDTSYHLLARRFIDNDCNYTQDKSDSALMADEIRKELKRLEVMTPLSYLNQNYYRQDRLKLLDYERILPVFDKLPFIYSFLTAIKKPVSKLRIRK